MSTLPFLLVFSIFSNLPCPGFLRARRKVLPTATTSSSTSFRAEVLGLLQWPCPARGLRPGSKSIARATPASLRCRQDRVLPPELTDGILTGSSFTSVAAITALHSR